MPTPMKAIRAKCLDCCCGQALEVRLCPSKNCSLYPYRFGHNPNRAGLGNSGSFGKKTVSASDLEPLTSAEGKYTSAEDKPENTPSHSDISDAEK